MRAQTAASATLTLTLTYPLARTSDLALPTAVLAAVTTAVSAAKTAAKQMRHGCGVWQCNAVRRWWGLDSCFFVPAYCS